MAVEQLEFSAGSKRLLMLQISIAGLVAAGFIAWQGENAGKAAIYGAGISVVLARLLSWGIERASREAAEQQKKKSASLLYLGAAQRFLLALVLFALGLSQLHLEPMPMIVGFVATQAAFFVFNRTLKDHKGRSL